MSKDDYIPPSIRILNLDFDSCLMHVDYNIKKLSEILTNEEAVHSFNVLNYIVPIITNICKLVEEPTQGHADDTFCISTRLESCYQEDIEKYKHELTTIRGNDIYAILKKARDKTVAHTNSLYQGFEATQKVLLEVAKNLIKHKKDRLINLVKSIQSLIHNVEISIRKKEGKPLNSVPFNLKLITPNHVSNQEPHDLEGDNLPILRGIDPECIDLIYLDSPFN